MNNYLMKTLDFRKVEFVDGCGSYLYDTAGERYMDFFTDVGTASLGYGGVQSNNALSLSKNHPPHAPNLYGYRLRNETAEKICKKMEMDKAFFCNSGTEAVEAAIKLARKYQAENSSRADFICAEKGGFHGRTFGSLAAGDGPEHHYKNFGPLPSGFLHFEFGGDISEIPTDAAAVLIAPVFGNGDVRPAPEGWLEELREYTSRHGVLLVFDEVQTGSGRVGAPTMAQKLGIKADIICLAKGVAMGCPVGAILATEEVAKAFTPGCHFSTFGGNPLSCAYTRTMMEWLTEENMESVALKGAHIRTALEELGWAKNVRGVGMLNAFDIDVDGIDFSLACLERGLLVGAFRKGSGPVKITPPLNIGWREISVGIEIMDDAYKSMKSGE